MISFSARHQQGAFTLDAAFEAGAGITALFGPSGSGKSTIIRLIAGLERPQSGRIAIDDAMLTAMPDGVFVPPHKRRIGLVFQDAQLFPHLSVRRNLGYGRFFAGGKARPIRFDQVVEVLGIGALLARMPAALSGGERQRVAMGRAILMAPRLLLMDEPLASLDQGLKRDILPFIERLRDEFGIPIIYVSHAIEEVARLAERVVRLESGRVLAIGKVEDVLASEGGDGSVALSLIHLRKGRYDQAFDVTRLDHPSGVFVVPGRHDQGPLRIAIAANQVAIVKGALAESSVRTTLGARIADIALRQDAYAQLRLRLEGGDHLIALVTRLAVSELALKKGEEITALVKSVAIDRTAIGSEHHTTAP
jgi:molybdate transport system ATP-binding protein